MTVTIIGTIKNSGEEGLDGYIRVTANVNFVDSDGEFHIAQIPYRDAITDGEFEIEIPETSKIVTGVEQVKVVGNKTLKYKFEFLDSNSNVYRVLDNIQIDYSASPIDIADLVV